MKGLKVKDYVDYKCPMNDTVQRGFILDIGRDEDGDTYIDIQNVSSHKREDTLYSSSDIIGKVKYNAELNKESIEFLIDLALSANDIKFLQELSILLNIQRVNYT